MKDPNARKSAILFIVLIGIVSLFADMTYEGARSITGPYLALLGASATVVGFVAGLGELLGYGLRLVSGHLTDRTRKYWTITFLGYAINMLAVPLLAFAGRWEIAAGLIILERIGKAIRSPAKDAMLSYATHQTGHGWGFGLHEAMDQIGAIAGPLLLAYSLYEKHGYPQAFKLLAIPAFLALAALTLARVRFPAPEKFEVRVIRLNREGLPKAFWLYLAGAVFIAAGYADFPLIAFHLKKTEALSDAFIPVLYAIAMGVDGAASLLFGRLFDRFGTSVLVASCLLSALFAPLVFLGNTIGFAIAGAALWGVGMGAQESILKAAIAQMVPIERRGSAYGIFNTGFGITWFLGSALMGILYDISVLSLVLFSVAMQVVAAILLAVLNTRPKEALQ